MFEKDVKEISLLLDFYGELLSERKQSVLALYYNEDFSLAEIAEDIGISRQGARELIKKAEEELGWKATRTLQDMCESSYNFEKNN